MSMFRKPSTKKMGLKVLALGEKGVGKSVFSLSFPRVFSLDAETGQAFYENHPVYGKNIIGIANTQDFNEMSEALEEITDAVNEDPSSVGTLVIDSETKFYQNLTDASLTVSEKQARKNGKDVNDSAVSMRGWGRIKAVAQRLANAKIDLSAKGVNVVSISQIDDIKQKVGENFVKIGEKPVMQKGSEYDYDIVIKLMVEQDANKNFHYKGIILKDRTGVTNVGQVVDNPSYDTWKGFLEGRQDAETIDSKLTSDSGKAEKALEAEDAKAERTVVDKLKDVMAKGEAQKAKALELIHSNGIKNPLAPKDAKELQLLEKIIETVEAI